MSEAEPYCVMLVAAEASGDALGGALARELRARLGDRVRFVGVGGRDMASAGVVSPFDIADLSILGMWEGLLAYPRVVRRADQTAALAAAERPDAVVLIDSWGFTLRVARRLRAQNPRPPLIKYVGPQVWASRPGRAKTLAATVDQLLSIHAFDAPFFEAAGLKTTFVGNSALTRDLSGADPQRLRLHIGAEEGDRILLLLPGSRPGEVKRLMPIYRETAERLSKDRPDLRLVLPAADTVSTLVAEAIKEWRSPVHVVTGDELKYDAMTAATAALACSGTVTTELALAGCPMVVTYKVGRITYEVLKRLLTTRYATLFNIAAGEAVAPELLQTECTPDRLTEALALRLDDEDLRAFQVQRQAEALRLMGVGGPDPAILAASVVIETLAAARPSPVGRAAAKLEPPSVSGDGVETPG